MTCFRRRPLAQRLPLKLLGTSTRSCFAVQDVVNTVYITSYHKDESFGRAQAPSTELNLFTHQTGNYPVTCFVSRPSGITLVKFSLQAIKTNLLVYTSVYHNITPPWSGVPSSIARQPSGCHHGTIPHVFGTLSARCFQRRPFWHRHYCSNGGDFEHGSRPRGGCGIHRRGG